MINSTLFNPLPYSKMKHTSASFSIANTSIQIYSTYNHICII